MGMFTSTIPVRINVLEKNSFSEFIKTISTSMLNNLKHQKFSYSFLLEELRKDNPNVSLLFDTVISYQITKAYNQDFGNYSTAWYGTNHSPVDCTIQITDINDSGNFEIHYDYLSEKYSSTDIRKIHERINFIVEQILNNPDLNISSIEVATPEERKQILYGFNNTNINYPSKKTIIDLFEEQIQKNPDKIAVLFENKKISYRELNEKANCLANYLINSGIENTDVISILTNRSINLIISIWGAIKSGASYVLIDNNLPQKRINYIIEDSGSKYCIVDDFLDNNLRISLTRSLTTINISKFYFSVYNSDNLHIPYKDNLCIIYTSGSTGKPKGVVLHKHGYYNLINAFNTDMNLSKYNTVLSIANISFDMFTFEVFAALLLGNTLVLANFEEQKNPIAMSNLMKKHNVEFLVTTPSRADLLLLEECEHPLKNVKAILLGGEKFTPRLYNRLKEETSAKIYNSFGPTEITSACTNKLIESTEITVRKASSKYASLYLQL